MKITLSRIVALVFLALLFLTIAQWAIINNLKSKNDQLKDENKSLIEFNEVFQDSVEVTTTKLNTQAAKVQVVSMELETVRKMSEDYRLEFISQFNSVHKKLKNLEAAAQIQAVNRISIAAPLRDTIFIDSLAGKTFKWTDQYNQVSGAILKDSIAINLISQVPIEGVVIEERENWRLFGKERKWLPFGKKRLSAELTSPNRSVQITKVSLLDVN
jgi:hypothetical protein